MYVAQKLKWNAIRQKTRCGKLVGRIIASFHGLRDTDRSSLEKLNGKIISTPIGYYA